jgi:hypothetical protein
MQVISRTPHFVASSQAGLYRDADLSIVWPRLVAIATIGNVYFTFPLTHFRNVIFGIEASLGRSHRNGRFGSGQGRPLSTAV